MAANKTVIGGSSPTASQLKDFFRQIDEGSISGDAFQRFLDHKNPWEVQATPAPQPILGAMRPVPVREIEGFKVKEPFVVNISRKAAVKISYLGDNFRRWFGGAEVSVIPETTLRIAQLQKSSVDGPIIAELGGEAAAETTLAEVWALIQAQPNGETGTLLINGYTNIFYVRDINGTLRAVRVRWRGGGWDVRARGVDYPNPWNEGYQVFSRNS